MSKYTRFKLRFAIAWLIVFWSSYSPLSKNQLLTRMDEAGIPFKGKYGSRGPYKNKRRTKEEIAKSNSLDNVTPITDIVESSDPIVEVDYEDSPRIIQPGTSKLNTVAIEGEIVKEPVKIHQGRGPDKKQRKSRGMSTEITLIDDVKTAEIGQKTEEIPKGPQPVNSNQDESGEPGINSGIGSGTGAAGHSKNQDGNTTVKQEVIPPIVKKKTGKARGPYKKTIEKQKAAEAQAYIDRIAERKAIDRLADELYMKKLAAFKQAEPKTPSSSAFEESFRSVAQANGSKVEKLKEDEDLAVDERDPEVEYNPLELNEAELAKVPAAITTAPDKQTPKRPKTKSKNVMEWTPNGKKVKKDK
jgi:hypothetical protein